MRINKIMRKTIFQTKQFIKPYPTIKFKINDCSTITGFSYKKTGWHHLIELLKELDSDGNLLLEESILYKFHEKFQPRYSTELVKHNNKDVKFKAPFGVFPWADFGINQHVNLDLGSSKKLENSSFSLF